MEAARRLPAPARYGLALLGVAVITVLIAALGRFHLANASMLYLIVVLLAAVALGRGPAVMVAFVAFLASNFFLVEPRFTLIVANPEEWVTLILLLLTAVVTGQVAAGQEQRAAEAEANAREARLLSEVAQLMTEPNLDPALGRVAERLRGELGVLAVRIVVNGEDGGLLASASAGAGTDLEALTAALAGGGLEVLSPSGGRWVRVVQPRAGRAAASAASVPALRLLRVPVRAPHGETGEVILAARRDSRFGPAEVRLLESVSAQLWGAVDRARLRDEANEAEVLRRGDQVKSALLDAVSHDLRTPLASILASAGSLRQRNVEWDDEARRSFAEAIEQEAHRLDRIVGNLLDLSRLESGALQPDRGWYEPTALINEVAARLRPLVAPHALVLDLPDELPPVHLDYSEVDQVLSNVIENAAKYSPPESEIRVTAAVADGSLRVDVSDQGPGVAGDAMPRLFEPFFRGNRGQRGGSGLGLAVARGLVEAHGGRIWAENRPEGGARFSFEIPDGTEAP
jgi:two-component system, OmpR family, sensor histidine kinase KdpD